MNKSGRIISILLITILLGTVLSGCLLFEKEEPVEELPELLSYRDIPGLTQREIEVIEKFRNQGAIFTFGMVPSTEAFIDSSGRISGAATHICNWLTVFFEIPFIPELFSTEELITGLERGDIDFTGHLSPTSELRRTYVMTNEIAQRPMLYFRLTGSPPLAEIRDERLPRYALISDHAATDEILNHASYKFEPILITDYNNVYEILKSGEADVFIAPSVYELVFDIYDDIETEYFLPLIYSTSSVSTQNPELSAIISVITKALDNGAIRYFDEFYKQGHFDFLRHKLDIRLTEEEHIFMMSKSFIPVVSEYDNYPVSFYNEFSEEWQGISIDIIREIAGLTGLDFEIISKPADSGTMLSNMLESKEAYMITELPQSERIKNSFLWSNEYLLDQSAFISKVDLPNIGLSDISTKRIGLPRNTIHDELFMLWFPHHRNFIRYESISHAFDALVRDDVDLVMHRSIGLLNLTQYRELSDYKVNVLLNNRLESRFGFNKDAGHLVSIVNKALSLIDTDFISQQWLGRTLDYRVQMLEAQRNAQRPWIISAIILSLFVLILTTTLFIRSRRAEKKLETTVAKRTNELKTANDYTTKLAHWYESILDAIPLPISVTDINMNWTFVNRATENYLGQKRGDMIGLHCSNWDAHICNTEDCGIERLKHGVKQTYFTHDNNSYKVDSEMLTNANKETIGFVEVVHDVTQVQALAKEKAEAESKAKSEFLAIMSHEIRTPINAILGITEILLMNDMLDKNTLVALDKVYASSDMLLGIINDILDLSKIESGKLELAIDRYELASVINDTAHLNMMRIGSKQIEFILNVDENTPRYLLGDELRLKQIFNNILSNAFKYTDLGTVELSITSEDIEAAPNSDEEQVELILRVRDTGRGMSEDQVEKLFDEYSRFNTSANRTTEGTGLGMSITSNLLKMMNGKIEIESKPGEGTTITVRLPQGRVDSVVLGKELVDSLHSFRMSSTERMKRTQISREPMPYGSVLVVDDVETNIYVAKGLLLPYDLSIDSAGSGFEAIEKIKNGITYDVVFMDHMMPKMDGMEATKIIRDMGYEGTIVALTANAVAGSAEAYLQGGFDDFISKPIDVRHLNMILNKYIRDKQPEDVLESARTLAQSGTSEPEEEDLEDFEPVIDPMIYKIFIRDAVKAIKEIEDIINKRFPNDEDINTYVINVHGIKSALRSVGKEELSSVAAKLEAFGREGNLELIIRGTIPFLEALKNTVQELDTVIEEKEPTAEEDEDKTYLWEKLHALKDACESYDEMNAQALLKELCEKNWSKSTKEFIDIIQALLFHSDFDFIIIEVDNFLMEYE